MNVTITNNRTGKKRRYFLLPADLAMMSRSFRRRPAQILRALERGELIRLRINSYRAERRGNLLTERK